MLYIKRRIIQGTLACFFLASLVLPDSANAFLKKPHWLQHSSDDRTFWSQMSRDFSIDSQENNPYIQKQIRWYQEHPKHLQRILVRAQPFINYVYQQTQRYNLPAELALIPLLESQYNPAIGASSGATGLWQMMPGTAAKFGLRMNKTYDGRRDVSASTKAALSYLAYLYHYFHKDWLLALAAYEAGEGKIAAVAGHHGPNFWNLPLSRQTKEYVPRLLAIATIIKKPEIYNVALPNLDKDIVLKEMTWREAKAFNFVEAARDTGVDDSTLRHFNPGIRQDSPHIPGTITLLIPERMDENQTTPETPPIETTRMNLASSSSVTSDSSPEVETQATLPVPEKPTPMSHYKVKQHDTLERIAKRHHTTSHALLGINHLKSHKLKIGQDLVIPGESQKPDQAVAKKAHKHSTITRHKIRSGDSLASIAKQFHVPVKKLQQTNHIKNALQLKIGQTLTIPSIKD